MSGHEDSIQAVWFDPTQYNPQRHGPPCLPVRESSAVKLASSPASLEEQVAGHLRVMAIEWSNSPLGLISALLVCLRSAAFVHQSHHWQSQGQSFYGDHLLFDRLYNESLPGIDSVAERVVGLGGGKFVHPSLQAKYIAQRVSECYEDGAAEAPDGLVQISLLKEMRVVIAVRMVLHALNAAGALTDGTENLLQGIADKHEEFVYLLKQRVGEAPYSYAR